MPEKTPQVDWGTAQPIQAVPSNLVNWDSATPINRGSQEQPGFLENLGKTFGISPSSGDDKIADLKAHPVRSGIEALAGPAGQVAEGLWSGGKRIGGELKEAFQAGRQGDAPAAASHAISAIPFVGPAMDKMVDESPTSVFDEKRPYMDRVKDAVTPGNVGTALGSGAQTAAMLLGGADTAAPGRPLLGQLPSAARAGKVFEDIRTQAKDVPVVPTKTMPELTRWQELTDAGGRTSKPMTKLSGRLQNILTPTTTGAPTDPFNFPEGRDFYSNVSDAAHQTPLQKLMGRGMKPTMRRQAVNVRNAFNDDLTSAADQIGRGEDYTNAMKEYANAKKLEKVGKGAALLGAGEVARRTGLLGKLVHQNTIGQ